MNFLIRILVVTLLVIGTSVITVKTVTILHNNQLARNAIAEKQKALSEKDALQTSTAPSTGGAQGTQTLSVKNSAQTQTQKTIAVAPSPYSLAKIALHASASDCWIVISNKIYGVSSFLKQHPGGAGAITPYCGKDATTAFQTHGRAGGSDHSSYAYSLLASYFVASVSTGNSISAVSNQAQSTTQTTNTQNVNASAFTVGTHIQISNSGIVNVRNSANGTLLGKQSPGATGVITGGPKSVGGYMWWNVNFDSGVDGWVAQNYIQIFSAIPVPVPVQPGAYSLTVTKTGSGSGTVSGGGISCGTTCSVAFTQGTTMTLSASPSSDSTFSGWSGACSGTGICSVAVTAIKSVTASFSLSSVLPVQPTPITPASSGYTATQIAVHNNQNDCWLLISGKVYNVTSFITNHPGGVSAIATRCGTDATVAFNTKNGQGSHSAYAQSLLATYYIGDLGTAVPTPPAGSYTLSVSKSGTGSGTVSGGGISCGATCAVNATAGTSVTLSATPTSGSTFSGWTGACSGTGSCTVTLNSNQSVGAGFVAAAANTFSLSITSIGGVVTSNPAGISCGSVCSATFAPGTSVTLSVSPTSGYTFSGWSGACSGTGSCTVSMNTNASVSTNYTTNSPAGGTTYTSAQIATHNVQSNCWLLISGKVYNVTSFITNHPGGVSAIATRCGTDATVAFNTKNGQGSHSAYAQSLLATYYIGDLGTAVPTPPAGSYTLSVSKSGTGSGTVSGGGISCGATCAVNATAGTSVTLSATPTSGSTFSGWTGACSGTGSCTVTLNSNQSVGAGFVATGGGGGGGGATTYTINVSSAGNYDVTNLTINSGDSIRFVYTPPISSEVRTVFSPGGISSITLDSQYTQITKTFSSPGTWTYKADDHNGNRGTLVVQ